MEIEAIKNDGLFKKERISLHRKAQPFQKLSSGSEVLKLCANNLLGP